MILGVNISQKSKIFPPPKKHFLRGYMSEGKPLTILEMVGIQDDFTSLRELAKNRHFPNVSKIDVDSIRVIVLKKTMQKLLKYGWRLEKVKSHTPISIHAKQKLSTKEVTSLYYLIAPSGFKNITLETPHCLNASSDYKKYKLSIFGLSQPKKPLTDETIGHIKFLLKRLEIDEIDICIDSSLVVNDEAFKAFGKHNKRYSTLYVNNPLGLTYITKVCYYDKQFKDKLKESLYRLELTCKTRGKIGTLFVPYDEVETVLMNIF